MPNIILEFQIGDFLENAISKAPADITSILVRNGYKKIYVKTSGGNRLQQFCSVAFSSLKLLLSAKKGSKVICQYPIYSKKGKIAFKFIPGLLKAKRAKVIALVHDLQFLRAGNGKEQEMKDLDQFDALIVHSERMASLLRESGYQKPCIVLGLFDYLTVKTREQSRTLSKTISFAGNLSKSGFISHLEELTQDGQVRFILYGRNDGNQSFGNGIEYGGLFHPDDVSSLEGSWGLVWDGPSIKELTGEAGLYQRVNSPHKASLYLVAGLPLIVNTQAAIAKIVVEEKLGIAVDSLSDIEKRISSLSEEDYAELLKNVDTYAERLKSGSNLMKALDQID